MTGCPATGTTAAEAAEIRSAISAARAGDGPGVSAGRDGGRGPLRRSRPRPGQDRDHAVTAGTGSAEPPEPGDAFGEALLDSLAGGRGVHIMERDDGFVEAMDATGYLPGPPTGRARTSPRWSG